MLTVACVLSEGPKRTYTREHVARLRQQVAGHLRQPYRFVCVDDSPLEGWWAKIDLFKPGRFTGRVLYLDLDTTVTGSLDDLADFRAPFCIVKDWHLFGFNSSVMAWDASGADHLYRDFVPEYHIPKLRRGDQQWIFEQKPEAAIFPRGWCVSWKKDCRNGVPDGAKVVCFHGFPKPWDLNEAAELIAG